MTSREASYGLFQLNTMGGQGSGYANNPEALFDPKLNASIALPPIAAAYREAKKKGIPDNSIEMAMYVAANSGHPGYGLTASDEGYSAVRRVGQYAAGLLGKLKDAGTALLSPATDTIEAVDNKVDSIGEFLDKISKPETWQKVLLVVVGIILALVGLYIAVRG